MISLIISSTTDPRHIMGTKICTEMCLSIYRCFDCNIWDNMKQPAAILVLQYWYTILVIPVSSSICNTGTDTGKY